MPERGINKERAGQQDKTVPRLAIVWRWRVAGDGRGRAAALVVGQPGSHGGRGRAAALERGDRIAVGVPKLEDMMGTKGI